MFSWMTYLKGHSTFLKWLVVVGCCVNFQSTLTVNTIEVVDMQRAYIQVYHKKSRMCLTIIAKTRLNIECKVQKTNTLINLGVWHYEMV